METIVSRLEVTRNDLGEWAACTAYWEDHVCRIFVSYKKVLAGWLASSLPRNAISGRVAFLTHVTTN